MLNLVKEIIADPLPMVFAVLVHIVLAAILFISLEYTDLPTPPQANNVVQAVAVDEKEIMAELEKIRAAEEKKEKAEQAKQRKLTAEKEAETRRLAEEKQKREAELARIAAEKARLAEEEAIRQQELKAEQERLAVEAEKRRQEEAEKLRQQEIARAKAELEAAMQAEIAAEQAAKLEEERKRKETERGLYIAAIKSKVQNNWLRPVTATKGMSCQVLVKQIPGGEVIDVEVTQCGDDLFQRSVEAAVRKSSPLPRPSDPEFFERQIIFTFKPEN